MKADGAHRYDSECARLREATGAACVAIVVLDGEQGTGYSVQALPGVLMRLPGMLEYVARRIRDDQTVDA